MKRIRVLVVEDSLTVRKRLCEILQTDPELEVVGEAEDGRQAIELCQQLRPDIITLDMMLPIMSGLAVTEYVMAHYPTPILVVSSSFNRGELFRTYEALAAGALEAIEKPDADAVEGSWERQFLSMVKLVSRVKVITHLRGRLVGQRPESRHASPTPPARASHPCALVAIGASTGGPRALVEVLQALPPASVPILLVIHIGEPFGNGFADWLDGQTSHSVRFARDGDSLTSRDVLLAPPGSHLVLRDHRLWLSGSPERHSCRPSVDVLFESIAYESGATAAAALLTGMGQDGAVGLLAIRRAGGFTIAQDEASSVVYGMPREAALIGAAERILPIGDIGPQLTSLLTRGPDR